MKKKKIRRLKYFGQYTRRIFANCIFLLRMIRTTNSDCSLEWYLATGFQARSQICEQRHQLLQVCPSTYLSVLVSVCMEQLGSHCTDNHEIQYLSIFRKFVQKIHVPLKSDKITGTLHEEQYTYMIISLNSCYNEKCCKQNLYKNQNTI